MLEESKIDNPISLFDVDIFIEFIKHHVDRYSAANDYAQAISNAKLIIKYVAGKPNEHLQGFDQTAKTAWLGTYACLRGALAASSVEDHKASGLFENKAKYFSEQYNDDVFICASHQYIRFLSRKHYLDLNDSLYPPDSPGMKCYLIYDLMGKSAYRVPRLMLHAMLRAAAVEARHRGFTPLSRLDFSNMVFEDFLEEGIREADYLGISQAQVMLRLSKAWSFIRVQEFDEAEDIYKSCRTIMSNSNDTSHFELPVDHLRGEIALNTSVEKSSQHDVAVSYLRDVARRYAAEGAFSQARYIYGQTLMSIGP